MILRRLVQLHDGGPGQVDPDSSPLPGGFTELVRFLMDAPQWLQIGGALAAAAAAAVAAFLVWRHRSAIYTWIIGLPTMGKAAVAAVLVALVLVTSVGGYAGYDYVSHDNSFCTGCHVMVESYVRFQESAHSELGCHDCHQQPISASMRQLYLWVLERPDEIGPHAPVPDARCASCHIDEDPERWPQIARSLGHAVHLESDDPELSDVLCVSCHGVRVHDFAPAADTCGDCHEEASEIRLGRMTGSTDVHCVVCHDFMGAELVRLEGMPDDLVLMPSRPDCLGCHEMEALVVEEELSADPHGAVCGVCHNPHSQQVPRDAVDSCTNCHEQSDTLTPFHRGRHADVHQQCAECHRAHSWVLDGLDCISCHEGILDDRHESRAAPTLLQRLLRRDPQEAPAETAPVSGTNHLKAIVAAARPPALIPRGYLHRRESSDARSSPPSQPYAAGSNGAARRPHASQDTSGVQRPFLHSQHRQVSCLECHRTGGDVHGDVTVRTPRDCAACHHDPRRAYTCESCHREADLPPLREVGALMELTVWDYPRERELPFEHETHASVSCGDCHGPGIMIPVTAGCADCHTEHHRPEMECARCHLPTDADVHPAESHLSCAGCHTGERAERPRLSRNFCLMCHTDQIDHEPQGTCHACHMIPETPLNETPAAGAAARRGAMP